MYESIKFLQAVEKIERLEDCKDKRHYELFRVLWK